MCLKQGVKARSTQSVGTDPCMSADNGSLVAEKVYPRPYRPQGSGNPEKKCAGRPSLNRQIRAVIFAEGAGCGDDLKQTRKVAAVQNMGEACPTGEGWSPLMRAAAADGPALERFS